jgi:hypothetical protein
MTLDRAALRQAAASRRNEIDVPQKAAHAWHCTHCLRDYQTETGFMKHHCPERERLEELKTPRGQSAYAMYSEWMRQHKRSVPAAETFMISKQYNYFMKFVDWSEKTAIPNPNQFIKLMVETGTQPVLWCRSATYALYLQWYDNTYPPEQQFVETLDRLHSMAIDRRVPVSELYRDIGPYELAKLVRRRKLSPWLLVVSPQFLRWATTLPQHDRDVLNEAIDFSVYAKKLSQFPELAKEFRRACESENV